MHFKNAYTEKGEKKRWMQLCRKRNSERTIRTELKTGPIWAKQQQKSYNEKKNCLSEVVESGDICFQMSGVRVESRQKNRYSSKAQEAKVATETKYLYWVTFHHRSA